MRKKRKPLLNFWEAFEKFPPYYVRLLAKEPGNGGHEAFSDAQIAIAAGLPINRVREIARLTQWDTVPFAEILAFTSACNFDPTNFIDRNRERNYLYICKRREVTPFKYLRKHPKWHSEFLPLVKMLTERFKTAQNPSAPVHV